MSTSSLEPPVRVVPPRKRISERFNQILDHAAGRDLTIENLEQLLAREGFAVFVLLLSLPFILPIPLPFSLPFGIAIFLISTSIALGRKPWLPRQIRSRTISFHRLEKLIHGVVRVTRALERIARPRMQFMHNSLVFKVIGWGMAFGGFLLCLPLPFPGTNSVPAISIILLAAGLIERDGVFVCLGFVMSALALAYIGLAFWLGKNGLEWLWHHTW
ncbi:MAG TPA: exopolysaccharide biosynthesis protein [Chthoniobacterales bacterium]